MASSPHPLARSVSVTDMAPFSPRLLRSHSCPAIHRSSTLTTNPQTKPQESAGDVGKSTVSSSHCDLFIEDSGVGSEAETMSSDTIDVSSSSLNSDTIDVSSSTHHAIKESHSCRLLTEEETAKSACHVHVATPQTALQPQTNCHAAEDNVAANTVLVRGQRSESLPFSVTLEQRFSGIGLILGTSRTGLVCIKYMVSFGSAAKDGNLK